MSVPEAQMVVISGMSGSGMTGNAAPTPPVMSSGDGMAPTASVPNADDLHQAAPGHAGRGKPLVPLSAVADVRIVEGPAMIKSENGRLVNTVTLNVRGRDMLGFVDEAQRVVAQ